METVAQIFGILAFIASVVSFQMKTYLEANYVGYETCAVVFAKSRKKVEKKYNKIMRQFRKKGIQVVEIPEDEFSLQFIPSQGKQTITNTDSNAEVNQQ